MFCKILVLFGLVAVARAGFIRNGSVRDVIEKIESLDPSHNPDADTHTLTGDSIANFNTKNGDRYEGSYRLIKADGTEKNVRYTVDDVNGFTAVISSKPLKTDERLTAAIGSIAQNPAGASGTFAKLENLNSSPEYNFDYETQTKNSDNVKGSYYVSAPIVTPQGVSARAAYFPQYPAPAVARIAAPLTYAAAGYSG